MPQLLQDVFREAINKAKETGVWAKLTMKQRETLVSKSLLYHFNARDSGPRRTRKLGLVAVATEAKRF